MLPPAIPEKTLEISNQAKVPLKAQSSAAAKFPVTVMSKTRLRPIRSDRLPQNGLIAN
jgi:alpha-N-acetylglucosamine transferase